MKSLMRTIESIQHSDFINYPVWEYANDDDAGEMVIVPVLDIPCKNADGKLFGLQVSLANGSHVWALISNIDVNNSRVTEQFLTISVEFNARWFLLARYHDLDYSVNGPDGLSRFLGLRINEIFPISYDITSFAVGDPAALSGLILAEPNEKLSQKELNELAIPD